MSIVKEFKDFAMKGNVLDMAVGVIIGGAFGKIVSSLVADVLMPLIGMALGKIDFSTLAFGTIKYGLFLQSIVDFIIVAACIFAALKSINTLKKPHAPKTSAPAEPPADVKLLTEIRKK
jgi:large conductance mechanosensitive channel